MVKSFGTVKADVDCIDQVEGCENCFLRAEFKLSYLEIG